MLRRNTTRRLTVGAATARALESGHPWVLPDRYTGSLAGMSAGQPIELIGPRGERLGRALADPGQRVVARLVGPSGQPFRPAERARAALERRRKLLANREGDVLRLVHGEADGLPGLTVDRYGDALVAVRQAPAAAAYCTRVYEVLGEATGTSRIFEKDHFADLRRGKVHGRAILGQAARDEEFEVRERGVRFAVRPFGPLATGFYPDQRANRERLARLGGIGRVLNLFSYTGAFSVALLVAGAGEAVDVDLAGPALRTARHNARLNGIEAERHTTEKADAAEFLHRCPPRSFDLVIVDPPTSARGGRGWSARRDLPGLLANAVRCLRDDGSLLLCVNAWRTDAGRLTRDLREAARAAGRSVAGIGDAPPSHDYPQLRGFPESRSFVGRLLQLR